MNAPTGSGKTIILANFIKIFLDKLKFNQNQEFAFVWFSPAKGGLPAQSEKTIKKMLSSSYKIFDIMEVIEEKKLPKNSVTIFSWSKGDKEKNVLNKESERYNFDLFLKQSEDINVIAIIDEEHYAQTQKTNDILDKFKPICEIRVSATPKYIKKFDQDKKVIVNSADVIEAGLIKKKFIQNDNIANFIKKIVKNAELGENAFFIDAALQKSKDLKKLYQKLKLQINPLIIIQLPDFKSEINNDMLVATKNYLIKKGLTFDNKKLAIHLDKEKKNHTDDILKTNDSSVICLITKQAIAHGWDCPRAHILIYLRPAEGSKTFKIQSLGRICRMPEKKHYSEEDLNFGFLYCNYEELVKLTYGNNDNQEENFFPSSKFNCSIKTKFESEKNIILENQNKNIARNYNNLDYAKKFKNWFKKEKSRSTKLKNFLANKFDDFKNSFYKLSIKKATYSPDLELHDSQNQEKFIKYQGKGVSFLEKKYLFFCETLSKKIKYRNAPNMREVLEFLFSWEKENWEHDKDEVLMHDFKIWNNDQNKINNFYNFFTKVENQKIIINWFLEFNKTLEHKRLNLTQKNIKNFSFPDEITYLFKNLSFSKKNQLNYKKLSSEDNCLYENFIEFNSNKKDFSQPEIAFMHYLTRNSNNFFEWWYRNQENLETSWKIIYVNRQNQNKIFYPDFIVKFNKQYWIIEVKDDSEKFDLNKSNKFKYLKEFCSSRDNLNFAFVIKTDKGMVAQNLEWSCEYQNTSYWKDIDQFFESQILNNYESH